MDRSVKTAFIVGGIFLIVLAIASWFFLKHQDLITKNKQIKIERYEDSQKLINNAYNYSVIIPSNWNVELKEFTNFSAVDSIENKNYCKIESHALSEEESSISIEEWAEEDKVKAEKDPQIDSYQTENFKIKSNSAKKIFVLSRELGNSEAVIFKSGGRIIQLVLYVPREKIEPCEIIFNEVLSSIDFINK